MKIIQVTAIPSTIKAFLLPLIERLSQQGHEVICVTSDQDGVLQKNEIIQKYNVKVCPILIPRSLSPKLLLSAYGELIKLFRELKPDVVHTHTPVASLLARKAATKAKVPNIIYTCHGFYFHENMPFLKKTLFSTLEKNATRNNTSYLFTVNQEDMDYALEHNFISRDRVININSIGIDTSERFNPTLIKTEEKEQLKQSLGITANEKVITFVGRLVAEKGIVELVKAFAILRKKRSDVKLVIVGETLESERDTTTKDMLKSIIRDNQLEDSIVFAGYQTNIPLFLSITDVFALPSYREGMPVASLEAMSMGVPVVGTNIRGLREEVIEGENGFLVPVKDYENLAAKLLESLDKFETPDDEIRKYVIQTFDQEQVLERQLKIYSRL